MAELSPQNALQMYRLKSQASQIEQATGMREMDPKDAIELLAYMTLHNTMAVQALHAQIEGVDFIENTEMPEPGSRN